MTTTPQRFRKKPVEIEAIRWTGTNDEEIRKFLGWQGENDINDWPAEYHFRSDDGANLTIHTLEGDMRASTGDWIIRGVQGEFYPCKPDIFEATYEPAGKEQP